MKLSREGKPHYIKLVWEILSAEQKHTFVLLLGMMIFAAFLETLSIAAVLPMVSILQDPDSGGNLIALLPHPIDIIFENTHTQMRIIYIVTAFFLLIILKNLYLAFVLLCQTTFSFKLQSRLSQKLLSKYLSLPYEYHTKTNSSTLIRNITTEVNAITFNLILPTLFLLSEALILLAVATVLLVIEPLGTLAAASILSVAAYLFNKLSSNYISQSALSRQYHEGQRLKNIQQALGAVKEVKVLGCEEAFTQKFRQNAESYADAGRVHVLAQQSPRLWVEVIFVGAVIVLILSLVLRGQSLGDIIPIIGLFAAAAFRMMPSVSKILTNLQNIKFALPALFHVATEFKGEVSAEPKTADRFQCEPYNKHSILKLENVSYAYPGNSVKTLKEVNIEVKRGDVVGISGVSGSGKTTLVDVILGLLLADCGKVAYSGLSTSLMGVASNQVGYVPQTIFLIDDTIEKNIVFGEPDHEFDGERFEKALIAADLLDLVKSLDMGIKTSAGERGIQLSGGQRQRIGIARALYRAPQLLILDEATSALDKSTELKIMRSLVAFKEEMSMVVVSHKEQPLKFCDKVYTLSDGRLELNES